MCDSNLVVGSSVRPIAASVAEWMGGYWGRTSQCQPCVETLALSCRAIYLATKLPGGGVQDEVAIIALDCIGVSAKTTARIRAEIAKDNPSLHVLVCATHTHTAPSTHDVMLGFGHASAAFMEFLLAAAVEAVREAASKGVAALMRHARTPPLGLNINRRQRTADANPDVDDSGVTAKRPKREMLWFEKAGGTTLGQRADGPTIPHADALHFVSAAEPSKTLATLLTFACHPVCCGKGIVQSSDYIGDCRQTVEQATSGAPAVFVTGFAGDANPLERGGGYDAARALGTRLGESIVRSLQPSLRDHSARGAGSPEQPAALSFLSQTVEAPLAPLPSEEDARAFEREQLAWLTSEAERSGADVAAAIQAATSGDMSHPCSLAAATTLYARRVLELVRSGSDGARSLPLNVCTLSVHDGLALVTLEAEAFAEYALHLERASPFATTLCVGYTNGCVGYLPTAAEFPLGGYEVVHAHVPYGQTQRLLPAVEGAVVSTALELLGRAHAHACGSMESTRRARSGGLPVGLPVGSSLPRARLLAETVASGFAVSHDTYNSIGVAHAAGQVLYVLSSDRPDEGARLYAAPLSQTKLERTAFVADVTTACADPPGCVVQGKAHVPLIAHPDNGKLIYFASHVGFYTEVDGMETLPVPPGRPAHLGPYPGGCVLELDGSSDKLRSIARLDAAEGVITMAADLRRGRVYCLSWPSAWLYVVSLDGRTTRLDYPGRGEGESVHPRTKQYRPVCRSMAVDPRSGCLYWSNSFGDVLVYSPSTGRVEVLLSGAEGLVRDYFGHFDPAAPGSMGYHWRQVQWAEDGEGGGSILGMHGNSGYLFRLSLPPPADSISKPELHLLERLTSLPSRRCGMADQFSYGYLGFAVERGVVYYLTGGPVFDAHGTRLAGKASTNKGEAKGLEHLHLVTYVLSCGAYADHGAIFLENQIGFPTYVNSIAVGGDGWVYALGRMPNGLTELFRVRDPHHG